MMKSRALAHRERSWAVRLFLVAAVSLGVLLVTQDSLLRLGVLQRLELAFLDYRFSVRPPLPMDSTHVVIVEIAEDSFLSIPGRFPWPRSIYAHLLRNLQRAGARVVAFDLILSGPDPVSPRNDSLFRAALHQTGIGVLAGKREPDTPLYTEIPAARNFGNLFYPGDSALGLVNIRPDPDGVYRTYQTAFFVDTSLHSGILFPTFAFAILNKSLGLPPLTVPVRSGGSFRYAGERLPAEDAASLLVNFAGPDGTFRHIKVQDVLDDETFTTSEEAASGQQINTFSDPEYGYLHDRTFDGKIVLVGVTVPEYKDLFPVPVARGGHGGGHLMYGVELHANVIESVLDHRFLRQLPVWTNVLLVFGLTALAFLGTSLIKEWKTRKTFLMELLAALGAVALGVLIFLVSLFLFQRKGVVLALTPAFLSVTFGYVASTTYHFMMERNQRLLIKSMFSTYVHPQLVEELVNDPSKLVLGGKREELTVLFSDLEGFTEISQHLEPEQLVALLNEYLSVMSEIIIRNRGTLDKYVGDAIMAFWGAPLPQEDHAVLACRTAVQMKSALEDLNQRWRDQAKPQFRMRMGIHTGPMVVGNMGATGKFAYTVMGDSVNLASRLEGVNKEYRTSIIISEQTCTGAGKTVFARKLDRIAVKGRSKPVTIYELLSLGGSLLEPALRDAVKHYEEGLMLYLERRFAEAASAFEEVLTLRPDDTPARLFLTRAREYAVSPPPAGWDGVEVMKQK
jgi:adenylate cyclase